MNSKKFNLQSKNFLFEKYNIIYSIFIKIFSKLKQRKTSNSKFIYFIRLKQFIILKIYNFLNDAKNKLISFIFQNKKF